MVVNMAQPTRFIIIAAGDGTRWGNYLGTTKHLAVLNGQPIIYRTIDLLRANGVSYDDIFVVSKDYNLLIVNNYRPKLNPRNFDADKFLSSSKLWNKEGRTVIVYGDVYFSEDAIKTIIESEEKDWRLFCRPTASKITGTPHGECFAISFYPHDHKYCYARLRQLVHLYNGRVLERIGGWEWARLISGIKPARLKKHQEELPLYINIDDETDDIDYPEDYDRLKEVVE